MRPCTSSIWRGAKGANHGAKKQAVIDRLTTFFDRFFEGAGVSIDEIDYVIPHQASRALPLIMRRIGIPEDRYANYVEDFGNMVSASVPFALAKAWDEGRIGRGSRVLLCGTAAGLTANALLLQL